MSLSVVGELRDAFLGLGDKVVNACMKVATMMNRDLGIVVVEKHTDGSLYIKAVDMEDRSTMDILLVARINGFL
jgi:hypothetical protein